MIGSDAAELGQWWSASSKNWSPVPPDYNWKHRRTGIRPEWSANFGTWFHYRPRALTSSSWWRRQKNGILVCNPRPWTVGRMCKFLRQVVDASSKKKDDDDASFELKSVYERSAKGDWAKGFIRRRDRKTMGDDVQLWEMGHVFHKTPYRITTLPSVLPPSLCNDEEEDDVGYDASRATIVMPDGCTVSGPRWLPTIQQRKDIQEWKGNEEGVQSMRFQFVELWLAEGTAESDKIGVFVMYDGITGELVQIFRMKETLLPVGNASSSEGPDPNKAISLDALEATIQDKNRLRRKGAGVNQTLVRALRRGQSLVDVFQQSHFTSFSGRAVRCSSPNGPEEEYRTSKTASSHGSSKDDVMMKPHPSSLQGHVDIRFNDGVYLSIPRSFDSIAFTDDDDICMELGCLRLDGGFHRVRMMGSRATNFNVCVYERWN
eukprot:CAMPEP_0195304214 /NCGR_PEP_ID=MMETSP0707-20130614/34065_1 /TAXON_ID=33640 /ORGANISM="Asterionellopsis glacialis, Strain CCMP134" /LENGTH=431 /DNA_ID=CAMNT_0040367969 /DNA_START=198 /DNA_END=1493 /DNA_ORIENTATION=+